MAVMNRVFTAIMAAAILASPAVAESPAVEAMQEYMEFSRLRGWHYRPAAALKGDFR